MVRKRHSHASPGNGRKRDSNGSEPSQSVRSGNERLARHANSRSSQHRRRIRNSHRQHQRHKERTHAKNERRRHNRQQRTLQRGNKPQRPRRTINSKENNETQPGRIHPKKQQKTLPPRRRKTCKSSSGGRAPVRSYGHVLRKPSIMRGVHG